MPIMWYAQPVSFIGMFIKRTFNAKQEVAPLLRDVETAISVDGSDSAEYLLTSAVAFVTSGQPDGHHNKC